MSREIKFRGLRTDGKGWVYGFLVIGCDATQIVYEAPDDNSDFGYKNVFVEVIYQSVGQLLHVEKDGREWYEGDTAVLTAHALVSGHPVHGDDTYIENEYHGTVCFNVRYGLCIKVDRVHDLIDGEDIPFTRNTYKTIVFSRTEITGNIHEHKDLLP